MTNFKKQYYYVVFSDTSRNSEIGLRPQAACVTRTQIIEAAAWHSTRSGVTLEDIAGIEMANDENGDPQYSRELTNEEVFSFSVEQLADDGRLYLAFADDDAGRAAFIEAAEEYGVHEQAQRIVSGLA